jgi:hypothetical protein
MPKTLVQINEQVSAAFAESKRDYRKEFPRGFVISRGRFLGISVADEHSNTRDLIPGEARRWDGTLADIKRLIEFAKKECGPNEKPFELSIFGGFDYADSLRQYQDGDYSPIVADWEIFIPVNEIET